MIERNVSGILVRYDSRLRAVSETESPPNFTSTALAIVRATIASATTPAAAPTAKAPAAAPATANVVYKSVIDGIMGNLKGKYKLKNGKTIQTNEDAYQYYRDKGNTVK
jgi:hypothetical protein